MNKLPVSVLNRSRQRQRFADLLRFCSESIVLDPGMQAHGFLLKIGYGNDLMLSNDLIGMYGKCGRLGVAYDVFDGMHERNVVSWTTLMSGYVHSGNAKKSLQLFVEMLLSSDANPNDFTFSMNLKACGLLSLLGVGVQIHSMAVKTGFDAATTVGNSAIDMYFKCGRIREASRIFETMECRNVISWNSMIVGYGNSESDKKVAVLLLRRMVVDGDVEVDPDEHTFTSMLKIFRDLGSRRLGCQIHSFLVTNGFPYLSQRAVLGSLVDSYAKCGKLQEVKAVFEQMEQGHVISWSAMLLAHAREGRAEKSMDLFRQLLREEGSNTRVDEFVLSSIISVVADLGSVEQGKQIHGYCVKVPCGLEASVSNSMVDMYLGCGLIEEARTLFRDAPKRNVISWTIMISGFGKHGLGKEATRLFDEMELDHVAPDDVTYLAVLLACSHSGLIEEGRQYFARLCGDEKVAARVEHYACMVDLLGRAGWLGEAKTLIDVMPLAPNVGIWQTLLSACMLHGNVGLGREVGEILLGLEGGDNAANHVLMSNVYAGAGFWNECEKLRTLAHAKRLKKEAGCSWLEAPHTKQTHYFYGRE